MVNMQLRRFIYFVLFQAFHETQIVSKKRKKREMMSVEQLLNYAEKMDKQNLNSKLVVSC
jgi:hypothetical protein